MEKKKNRAMHMMKSLFWLMLLGVFAYFILGEVLLFPEREKMGMWFRMLEEYGIEVLLALFLMAAGIISVVFGCILRAFYHQKSSFGYLGSGIFLTAVWFISESRLRQLLFADVSLIESLAFYAIMLTPLSYLIYVNNLQKNRYQKIYLLATIFYVAEFAAYAALRLLKPWEQIQEKFFIHPAILVEVIVILITLMLDCRRKYIKEYQLAAIGIAGVYTAGGIELILFVQKEADSTGIIFGMGLLFLLFMAALKTGQDILNNEKQKQDVIEASESKEKFLANMSHEIRTPINTIIGMNEMILRENQEKEIQEYAVNIQRASKMLLSLINDLLDFSKIEAGKLDLVETSYQLSSLLNDVIHVLEAKAQKKGLEVKLNIDEELPEVLKGDEIRIKQILTNLLTNAVKYTKAGKVTFSVQSEWSDKGDFTLKMAVADTGIGIKKEDLGKLFDSFTRLEEKKNRTIEGTGLGLNITKHLIEQMNGQIRVQSVYGKGSIFSVRIPQEVLSSESIGDLQQAYEKEISENITYKESFYAPDACVLAVDDNEMNLAVVRGLLKGTGIQLDEALGGNECLGLCRKKKYDLILMDHMMPEPDGIETFHILKEEGNPNRDTKVIALTANALAGVREEYLNEGFTDYLSKPIEAGKLEKLLQKHLPKEKIHLAEEEKKQSIKIEVSTEQTKETEASDLGIDRKLGITYCNDSEEMYQEILKVYYEQGQKYKEDLLTYYREKEWKRFEILVHALKSNSMSIGAKQFSEEARWQEMLVKEGVTDEIEAKITEGFEQFYKDYETVLNEAEKMLKINESQNEQEEVAKESISKEEYLKECKLLLEHIRGFEMNESLVQIEKMEKVRVISTKEEESAEILERIKDAVDGFDYDGAENYLMDWIKGQEEALEVQEEA